MNITHFSVIHRYDKDSRERCYALVGVYLEHFSKTKADQIIFDEFEQKLPKAFKENVKIDQKNVESLPKVIALVVNQLDMTREYNAIKVGKHIYPVPNAIKINDCLMID